MGASERDEFLRTAWRVTVAGGVGAERFVFVDECGANTSLHRLYAWSRRGERAPCSAPRNWGANVTLLASMTLRGMGPCLAVEGPTTKAVFETYVEWVLAPSLRPGQLVVMDNLSLLWADGAYTRGFREWALRERGWRVEVPHHPDRQLWRYGLEEKPRGFLVLPRRWVVERTFAWLGQARRLAKDYERLPETGVAMILWAMSRIMLRRLTGAVR